MDDTFPAVLGLALGMDQARVTAPFSGSRPEPVKPHFAPLQPVGVMVAVGGAFAIDNEYWTECEAVEEAPVTVTAYVPTAAVVLLMVREAEEPAANDCGLTVADTD